MSCGTWCTAHTALQLLYNHILCLVQALVRQCSGMHLVPGCMIATPCCASSGVACQGRVSHLIFSGSHPGDGIRNVTEANAMLKYALSITQQQPPHDR